MRKRRWERSRNLMSCLVFQLAKCPTEKFKKKTAQELKSRINPQSSNISIRTTTRTNTFENWFKNHLDNDVMNRNMGDLFSLFRPDQSAAECFKSAQREEGTIFMAKIQRGEGVYFSIMSLP